MWCAKSRCYDPRKEFLKCYFYLFTISMSFDKERYPNMFPIYLVEGPVGAGKSTFAQSLATQLQGTHIALDEWFSSVVRQTD